MQILSLNLVELKLNSGGVVVVGLIGGIMFTGRMRTFGLTSVYFD